MKMISILLLSIIAFQLFAAESHSVRYQDDDYPVTDEMIKNAYTIKPQGSDRNDMFYFLPIAVFKDMDSQQVLFIELGTDWHRNALFQFYSDEIPDELIQRYSRFGDMNKLETDVLKKINASIENATVIEEKYFTTKKNFRLGMSPKKGISIYGEPTKKIHNNNSSRLIWDYYGIYSVGRKEKIPEEFIAKYGYGFTLEILFRNDKARFISMANMIP